GHCLQPPVAPCKPLGTGPPEPSAPQQGQRRPVERGVCSSHPPVSRSNEHLRTAASTICLGSPRVVLILSGRSQHRPDPRSQHIRWRSQGVSATPPPVPVRVSENRESVEGGR